MHERKVALITGANKGLGFEIARQLGGEGITVVLGARDEAKALQPLAGRPPFAPTRELIRVVAADCCVEVDTNAYSVPWRLLGERVRVAVTGDVVRIAHGAGEVAVHALRRGRKERAVDPAHFAGIGRTAEPLGVAPIAATLLRPLAEYEAVAGGAW